MGGLGLGLSVLFVGKPKSRSHERGMGPCLVGRLLLVVSDLFTVPF